MIFVIKLTLLQNYTHFTTPDRHFIKTRINITIFDTFDGTVPLRGLRISLYARLGSVAPERVLVYDRYTSLAFFPIICAFGSDGF